MSDFINIRIKVGLPHHLKSLKNIRITNIIILYVPPFSDFCEISGIFQRILCCSAFLSRGQKRSQANPRLLFIKFHIYKASKAYETNLSQTPNSEHFTIIMGIMLVHTIPQCAVSITKVKTPLPSILFLYTSNHPLYYHPV